MPPVKRKRKLFFALGIGLGIVLLLVASFPLWFPWFLRPVLANHGIRYAEYHRDGYQRFTIRQAAFTNDDIRVSADRVDAFVPTVWLYRRVFSTDLPITASIKGWQLELIGTNVSKARSHQVFVPEIVTETDKVLRIVKYWVRGANISDGVLRLPDFRITVPFASWTSGDLTVKRVDVTIPALNQLLGTNITRHLTNITVTANLGKPQPWQVKVSCEPFSLNSTIDISTNLSGIQVQSVSFWRSNRMTIEARFGNQSFIPETAALNAPRLYLSGEELKDYSQVQGSFDGKWAAGKFSLDLVASGMPAAKATNFPPLNLDLHASGDTNALVLHSATITSPYLEAKLSQDFKIFFTGEHVRETAQASVRVDLAKQRWIPLEGILRGDAQFRPDRQKYPRADFQLKGKDFGNKDLKAGEIEIAGNLNWPQLEISRATAKFEDNSQAQTRGSIDLEKKEVLKADLDFQGNLLKRWLPKECSYSNLHVTASADGPWQSIHHTGHCEIGHFVSPQFKPANVTADWNGTEVKIVDSSLSLSAGHSTASVESSFKFKDSKYILLLKQLKLKQHGQEIGSLQKPATLSATLGSKGTNLMNLRIDSFEWTGNGGTLQVSGSSYWPQMGSLSLSIEKTRSEMVADFLEASLEPFEIQSLKADADWTNGPLHFSLNGSASMTPVKDVPLTGLVNVMGTPEGLTISNLVINSQTSSVATAHGFLPLTIHPNQPTNLLHLETRQDFRISATTDPQSFFWQKLSDWTGLGLVAPNLHLRAAGTLDNPGGTVRFQASQIRLRNWPTNAPPFDDIDLAIDLDRQTARIRECQFLVQSQPVRLIGELPLGKSFWSRETKLPDWKTARGRLTITQAQLAAFTPMFPALLSPQGELNVDAEMQPGPKFEGTLNISRARTRPLAALGPIRDISVNLKLHESQVKLDSATADIGGAAVRVTGSADLGTFEWGKFTVPPFKLSLKGTNVPLARQPESIIRSDLDLIITKTNQMPAVVSGKAHLRDSFFLHDIADLVPGKVSTPSRRPPYFSIDADPLGEWRLAVQVTGERFLKVRSTIFNGEVSANLGLQGTMKEPLALGDVRIDSGLVRFPFANLKVQQGFVTLTSKDPYRPQLMVSATSKQYGYDIKLEVTGPADTPILQFTSTPPLTSEQIVLMVTAGALPRDERSLSTQQRAETLALYVGRDLLTRLGFGDEKEQRLTFHSGEQLSDQGRPTYNVEYELTDRWSLVGEYDRFNAFNAGLKWRIYSK